MEYMNNHFSEEHYLDHCLEVLHHELERLERNSSLYRTQVIGLKKNFWEDVKVNVDSAEDALETSISIKQQAELLSERERNDERIKKRIHLLTRLTDSPYFARIDFLQRGQKKPLKVYIGISTLMDEKEDHILIYDWRAPISSMFYDALPGAASYDSIDGTIHGEMLLKRQFIIKNGKLHTMFDTGIAIEDTILKEMLSQNASEHMRTIVTTIQKEQNKIVRHMKTPYVIVDGVAGSGKTAVALQRVAYLLYRYRDQLTADQILLISPNQLFNRYINNVLPDLGEENMQQLTFWEYIEKNIGSQYELEHPYQQLEMMLSEQNEQIYRNRLQMITYKASLHFQHLLDAYVSLLSEQGMQFKNIIFRGEKLISAEQIKHYFYSLDRTISIPNRLQLVKEWLLKEIVKKEKIERTKEWVEEKSDLLDTEDYTKTYRELLQEGKFTENSFDDFEQERAKLAIQIVKKHFKPIKQAIQRLKFVNVFRLYSQLFQLNESMQQKLPCDFPENWEMICRESSISLKKRNILYEDATPFLYLQDKIEGKRINPYIRHVVIDEAQDYSPFQLYVLKQVFPYAHMTILGDHHQTIHPHTFQNPSLLAPELYGSGVEKMTLNKSYRSTKQITHLTSSILRHKKEIQSFNRDGKRPTLNVVSDEHQLVQQLVKRIQDLKKNYETIAVICKTAEECKKVYPKLQQYMDIKLIDYKTTQYQKSIVLLPVYMAKGIEFDAVLIWDASATNYQKEMERNYFYTACSRAMHELHIYALGEMTKFLENDIE